MSKPVALVTGASRGIGRGIAEALARQGWMIAVNYRGNQAAAEACAQAVVDAGSTAVLVQGDIGSAEDRDRVVSETLDACGGIDLLVNNAGMAPRQRLDLLEMSEASYDEVMNVNLKGPVFLTQRVARVMLDQVEAGRSVPARIINIGSLSAYTASINRGEYCISKAGLGMMTALFAERLAPAGISVFEIRPGIIETDMTSRVKERYDQMLAQGLTPINRWGTPDDIGRAVAAIASGAFPFSTGEVINVDGGFHLRRL